MPGILDIWVNYKFHNNDDENNDNNNELSLLPPITITKTTEVLEKVIKFQESLEVRKG
ncbi:37838_t:CDS:2, partial [Gigaspora margarita]